MSGYIKIPVVNGGGGGGTAEDTTFDPSGTGLSATNVQDAIVEVFEAIDAPSKYSETFNTTTDWTLNSDYYEIEILASTHSKGVSPNCKVYENISSIFYLSYPSISMNSSGDLYIRVTASPDNRFSGKLTVQ